MNKNEEKEFAKFFISQLNNKYNFDYKIVPNDAENVKDGDVDIFALSSKHPKINLQLTTWERLYFERSAEASREAESTGSDFVWFRGPVLNKEKGVREAIIKKENKYSQEVKKNLILLITGSLGPLLNDKYAKKIFADLSKSTFKGLYSVHFPSSKENSSQPHNGEIIAIKNVFGDNGEVWKNQ